LNLYKGKNLKKSLWMRSLFSKREREEGEIKREKDRSKEEKSQRSTRRKERTRGKSVPRKKARSKVVRRTGQIIYLIIGCKYGKRTTKGKEAAI